MPMPVRSLPVLQNWDCGGCTDCCREYHVHVTPEERARIEGQGWDKEPGFAGVPLFVAAGPRRKAEFRLNHGADGACIFLGEGGRCRIHAKFGSAAKPLACRIYPFVLVPAGDHWRVGLRFACPAAAASTGRPLGQHTGDIRAYVAEFEKRENVAGRSLDPTPLQGRQAVGWSELDTFVKALAIVVSERHDRVERRLRTCLWLAHTCRKAKFDKIGGKRLDDFLSILIGAADPEVPSDPAALPPPSGVGRILFRQMLALYSRSDTGPIKGRASRSRVALLFAAVRFARGTGAVPPVNALIPPTTFEKLEEPFGPLPDECEQILERYYLVKLHSMQFFGPTNFRHTFWDGLESLILTYPVIMWLTRALSQAAPVGEAILQALRIADNNFGFHPMLGTGRQKFGQRILTFRDEIPRLVAWYSR